MYFILTRTRDKSRSKETLENSKRCKTRAKRKEQTVRDDSKRDVSKRDESKKDGRRQT